MPAEISVLIITRGRPSLLKACLDSVVSAGGYKEIIVGVNGGDPGSPGVISAFGDAVTGVQLPRMCRGEARNALAERAGGRWLCFLDDDTVLPPGYFSRLDALIQAVPGAAVFGGGQLLAGGAGAFESAVYALLASPWGSGPFTARFRPAEGTRPEAGAENFILCNLTVDREFLAARGFAFEGHVSSAEENLLLNRMAAAGAKMVLSGDLNLVHRRRGDLWSFIRQVFSSGRGRAQITALSSCGFDAFTLLPPAALTAGLLLMYPRPAVTGRAVLVYALCCAAAAVLSAAPRRLKPAVAALFPLLHAGYAAGWLYGGGEALLEIIFRRRKPARCRCEGNT